MEARSAEIVARFQESWVKTEQWYEGLVSNHVGFEPLRPILALLARLKAEGASDRFRVGTSMHDLIFSRSVDHGLRDDQKCVKVMWVGGSDFEIVMSDRFKRYREYRVSDLNDERVSRLLKTLEDTLVD